MNQGFVESSILDCIHMHLLYTFVLFQRLICYHTGLTLVDNKQNQYKIGSTDSVTNTCNIG